MNNTTYSKPETAAGTTCGKAIPQAQAAEINIELETIKSILSITACACDCAAGTPSRRSLVYTLIDLTNRVERLQQAII